MSRKCKVCSSYHKDAIERQICFMDKTADTYETIAAGYENMTAESVKWHKLNHMSGPIKRPLKLAKDTSPDDMLIQAEIASKEAYTTAMNGGDSQLASRWLSNYLEIRKLLWKREDEHGVKTELRLQDSEEWVNLRSMMLRTLEKYPDALAAIKKVLGGG